MKGKIVGMGDRQRYYIDGKEVSKALYEEVFPNKPLSGGNFGGPSPSGWPIHSEAMAVHPLDVDAAIADAKLRGVPTDFDRQGRPILLSPDHQKRYLKLYQVHNKADGGSFLSQADLDAASEMVSRDG